jgi:hypothetical protein
MIGGSNAGVRGEARPLSGGTRSKVEGMAEGGKVGVGGSGVGKIENGGVERGGLGRGE